MADVGPDTNQGPLCSQCGTPAVVSYQGNNLCVDHHLKVQQAAYLQTSMLTSHLNMIRQDIDLATGGILGPRQPITLSPPPYVGDKFTLNHINVSGSTIGNIATGTVQQLDASITIMHGQGNEDLANAVAELTQAILDSSEINESTKKEVAE